MTANTAKFLDFAHPVANWKLDPAKFHSQHEEVLRSILLSLEMSMIESNACAL